MKINDEFHRKAILLCVYELTGRGLDEVGGICVNIQSNRVLVTTETGNPGK